MGERSLGKKDREVHARIDELEKEIVKDKAKRQEFEWNIEGGKGIRMQRTLRRIWRRNWREQWNR